MSTESSQPPVRLYTVAQAATLLTISRSQAYVFIASGALSSVRIGRLRRVTAEQLATFIGERHDV